ncbi:MAG: M67 family metallopeptidase [Armatimonadota bacterium]|nr:M67 family metallopeptidase [Armatimonadota bacterium]MDR7448314.1 M67 family metallopeptidase [Armatimonadota bacterium]MDR7459274.1 M67 family metallopeptidase [Armatimonadota bacterium]MDR7478354.1 M67 family metallopeptidase [Armatimonadota bacterium]MDR7487203.1 M67 family metallopeptidase [Armatimonadota bacterium]
MPLRLTRAQADEIVAHAQETYPNECVGLLAGREGRVLRVYRGRNVDESPYTYRLDDRQLLAILRELDEERLDLVGIYHSHTASDAYPSRTDVARAFYPDAVYVIVSLKDRAGPVLRGFRIVDGAVTEEPLELEAVSP